MTSLLPPTIKLPFLPVMATGLGPAVSLAVAPFEGEGL